MAFSTSLWLSSSSSTPKMLQRFLAICVIATLFCSNVDCVVLGDVSGGGLAFFEEFAELQIRKSDFPSDFNFGVGTSAGQIEGSANEGGRGPSVWDYFTTKHLGRILDSDKFSVAIDGYKRYKEDIQLIKNLGVNSYRFSISWSRILPKGTLSGGINQEGVDHYNSVIDELIKNGITPFVTLYHFDLPQALQDKYGGILSSSFVNQFTDYSDLCFKLFGDRVKHWFTMNEPSFVAQFGYEVGIAPPGRCSIPKEVCVIPSGGKCMLPGGQCIFGGNSSTEPYIAAHNLILAHANVAQLYRENYKAQQKGEIGIVLATPYFLPYSESCEEQDARNRYFDFIFGWFMDPFICGEYPKTMRTSVKERLPVFTEKEKMIIKGSLDFVGINYYISTYVKNKPPPSNETLRYTLDVGAEFVDYKNISSPGLLNGHWAEGLEKLMYYIKEKYNNPKIYISENGVSNARNDILPLNLQLNDSYRVSFVIRHLYRLHKAIKNGVNVQGYFHWALLDNFEWTSGFQTRFGLYHVDFNKNYTRIPKLSVKFFQDFIGGKYEIGNYTQIIEH